MKEVKWTRSFVERVNNKLRAAGLTELIISNNRIYRNEYMLKKGIGIDLETE